MRIGTDWGEVPEEELDQLDDIEAAIIECRKISKRTEANVSKIAVVLSNIVQRLEALEKKPEESQRPVSPWVM